MVGGIAQHSDITIFASNCSLTLVCFSCFSDSVCHTEVPDDCKGIIPYVSYPNELLQLYDETEYYNRTAEVWKAAQSCNNTDAIIWGACNAIYPRCLGGYPLYLCKETCLGESSYIYV